MASKMAKVVTKRPRPRLRDTNCQLFAVTIEIPSKEFRRDAFLRALPIREAAEVFRKRGVFTSVCNRKTSRIDYQAHVHIHKLVKGSKDVGVAVHVDLLPTKSVRVKGEKPPFAEEIFQWVRQFISDGSSIRLFERCEFLFSGGEYKSVFSLPLRMSGTLNYTRHSIFENSQMVGVRIMLARNPVGLISVIQEVVKGKGIVISASRRTDADPSKLLTVESDIAVVYNVIKSSVQLGRDGND